MKNFNWQQIQEVFATAVALKDGERRDYLRSVETTDRRLHGEVVSLLSADRLDEVLPNSTADFASLTRHDSSAAETSEFDNFETSDDFALLGELVGGRYQIVKRLGSGGMGDVYLAHDRNVMNRETVVKLLKSETLANREIVRKFQQEIEALARLKDSGIVTILDSGTYGKQPFLVLEYVEGEDLALKISPVLFSGGDFLDPRSLAEKLRRHESKLTVYLWRKFTPAARELLSGSAGDKEINQCLRDELTRLLADPRLYDAEAFKDMGIAPPEYDELEDDRSELLNQNRRVLEAAFPGEITPGGEKRLSPDEAAILFRQLGDSLTHGHSKGIIHRDLKPANIMIARSDRGEWQTKLIDFGVAKVRESLVAPTTELGLSFGTRKYMSPEQINAKPNLTPACDIYALGLIAFESLTGQHAFPTQSFVEQCRMQELEQFSEITVIRPDLPVAVKDVICRALSYKPENRQTSATEFGNALAEALTSTANEPAITEPAITVPFVPPRRKIIEAETEILDDRPKHEISNPAVERKKGGNPLVFSAVAVIILAMLGFGGWFVWRNYLQPVTVETNADANPTSETVRRELNYKLIVQKYYEGKPFQSPFEATGDEIFGDDWRFRLAVNSPQSGNLYLLAENPKTRNLTMLFPHPQKNGGASAVKTGEKIETGEMMFDKNQGAEKFWIVWADQPVAELEAVKSYVNPQDAGRIKDAEKEKSVRTFLDVTGSEKVNEKNSADKTSKNLQTTGEVLVKMAEFRHN